MPCATPTVARCRWRRCAGGRCGCSSATRSARTAARAVREAKSDARILFVTVDPANDTPDALRRFAARFHGAVTPLTGDSAALAGAWKGYGVYVIPPTTAPAAVHAGHLGHAPAPGQLTHSGVVYGIDRRGDLRVVITEGAPEDQIRDDVETLTRL